MFNIKLKTTTAIYCPYCHSPLVEHEKPTVSEDSIEHGEFYGIRCKNCGAIGYIYESWELPKQAKKESQNDGKQAPLPV